MLENREKTILKGIFGIVLFYAAVQHIQTVKGIALGFWHAISPLVYGIVIAFVINLIVVRLEKHMQGGIFANRGIRRTASITLSVLILTGVIVVVCFALIPGIVDSVKQIADKAPHTLDSILDFLEKHLGISQTVIDAIQNFEVDENLLDSMFGLIENQSVIAALKASGNMVSSIFAVIARLFVGLFFAFYILAQKESIGAHMRRLIETYLPERVSRGLMHVGTLTYDTYAGFISGQCMDAVILGCLVMLSMGIMRLSYPVLIGVIVTVTALIPVVGALFGGSIGVLLLVMDSPVKALTFVVLFLILQQIDNRLIYPHVVGSAIGIPSILIFAAIVFGGEIKGVLGMFLGIPFTAVIYTLVEEDLARRESRRECHKETARRAGSKPE